MRALALVVVLITASCGSDVVHSQGPQEYEGTGRILEDGGHGPELCLGGMVMTSDPVQCRGLQLVGWDWGAVEGEESRMGTTTIGAHVRGTLAGNVFRLTAPPRPPGKTVTLDDGPGDGGFSPACDNPSVVDRSHGFREWEGTGVFSLPARVASWINEVEGGMVASVVMRPGHGDEAERVVRERYLGRLCVVERDQPTSAELAQVQERLMDVVGQMVWLGYPDERRGVVRALITYVDDATRGKVEQAFGRGRVELIGALTPVRK